MTAGTRKLAVAAVTLDDAGETALAGAVALRAVRSLLAEPVVANARALDEVNARRRAERDAVDEAIERVAERGRQ